MFSELVDSLQAEVNRRGPDDRDKILNYVNATIRELQVLSFFDNDLVETTLTATASPHIWTHGNRFRAILTVRYPNDIYPIFRPPGRHQLNEIYYYYKASTYIAFAGIANGAEIDVAYYEYARRFNYYAEGERPAVYNTETETWTYLDNGNYVASLGDEDLEEAAREKVSNWLLRNWYDAVMSGAANRIYLRLVNDQFKARSHYAAYQEFKNMVMQGELTSSRRM